MPSGFPVGLLELAWSRRMLCAAEIVDAVTLEPVTGEIKVRAQGLKGKPSVNRSGRHYWLEEGGAQPQRIFVDASNTRYADAEAAPPVPPNRSVRIELSPRASYPFPPGVTALRGTLRVSRFGPARPVSGASVRLQWSDGTAWSDAPTAVTSDERGDFAAPLRLAPKDEPRLVSGGIAVRLRVERGGITGTSDEFALPAGQVSPATQPFIWDDLQP
jgi:hypothetical protein